MRLEAGVEKTLGPCQPSRVYEAVLEGSTEGVPRCDVQDVTYML